MSEASPLLWQVWRRPRHSRERWQKVPGLEPMEQWAATKAAQDQEWLASYTDWEYAIAPVGKTPGGERYEEKRRGTFYEGYRTKEMKPR